MRTQGAFYADSPHFGGFLFAGASSLGNFSANLVLTRNALGDYSLNRTAAGAETYRVIMPLIDLKRIIEVSSGEFPFAEKFGAAAGTAGYPAGAAGIPPFSGASQLTPATAQPAKGLKFVDVFVVYQVGVASLTSAALSLNRTVFADVTAPVVTNLAIDATALTLTANANPRLAIRTVNAPAFETTDLSDLNLEFEVVMQNTGTIRIYGLGAHVTFNYN